jgi:hypothetical protein
MPRISAAVIAVLAATTVVLAGCSGASHSGKSASAGQGVSYGAQGVAVPSAAASAAGAPDKASAVGAGSAVPLRSTALIETADLTVQTAQVPKAADAAISIAMTAGGTVTADIRTDPSTDKSGQHTPATADLTLAVPPALLDTVLTQLDGLGSEQSRHTSTQDVTGQVADVNSRLQALFAKAVNVTDIVALENELSQREADLESLQAQQRALSAETSNATITLHLVTAPVITVATHHSTPRGFIAGLSHGWHAFATAVAWLLTAIGAGLPFLVLLALAFAAYLVIRRRLGTRLGTRATPPATAIGTGIASGPGVGE